MGYMYATSYNPEQQGFLFLSSFVLKSLIPRSTIMFSLLHNLNTTGPILKGQQA